MSCEECRELRTHKFHSPKYLLNAIEVARDEVKRGVLSLLPSDVSVEKQLPLESFSENAVWPDIVQYRFKCKYCHQKFELISDTYHGNGKWVQEGHADDF